MYTFAIRTSDDNLSVVTADSRHEAMLAVKPSLVMGEIIVEVILL